MVICLRVFVATVGASLISNYCRDRGVGQDGLMRDRRVAVGELVGYLKSAEEEGRLLRACAETNTLERVIGKGDFIYFLHSETDEGVVCAEALKEFYEGRGYGVRVEEVRGLRYDDRKFKVIGLHSLVNRLTEIVEGERRNGREVVFAATGGFKAEMAYTTITALIHGVEAYYIHERFDDVISLPVIPLFFSPDLWFRHEEDVKWLAEEPRSEEEIKRRFGEDLKYFWALLEEVEKGKFGLSPAGWLAQRVFTGETIREIRLRGDPRLNLEAGGHRTVWGLGGQHINLNDIPDKDARKLLKRLLSLQEVSKVRLGEFKITGQKETFLEYRGIKGAAVKYRLHSKGYGIQDVEAVANSPGGAEAVRDFIGSKAYP
ncbi:MAG: putative CRISPR-associated protein [Candidatus Freyarchaeota archaeon]